MKVEVKETQSQEVDWSKNPQLVISKNSSTIVMSIITRNELDDSFEGVVMVENQLFRCGYFDKWTKANFKPFNGEITLKND
jgi:hypothetical protein